MAVTRSHSLKQGETVDTGTTGTTVKARQTTSQQTKNGKPKKKRNKTSAGKATKTPKTGNGQVVAQQQDPSTDPQVPLQMVSIPTDIVYKLNVSKMQHFVVDKMKEETDTSIDATLSQSSAQDPLQRDSTADLIKSIDSTLSAEKPVEKPLSADEMNVRSVMDLQDFGIPIVERYGHSSPSSMNIDSLTVIKEGSQSHLETVRDDVNLSELTSASPQRVNSQQIVYHSVETVDTGTTVKARQTTSQQTKKGKRKKKRNKTPARKATKTPKIVNGQDVAQKDPSTDPQVPLQMVSIPTDVVYKLNVSKMQHFVVDEMKEEPDKSVDATLSQSSAHLIQQEPLQRDSTADSIKSIDSTLSAEEPTEKPLLTDEMNVLSVMLQDFGIPIVERYDHSSPNSMNVDLLKVIKEETQSQLETVGVDAISPELKSASPQGVDSEKDLSQMLEMDTHTKSELERSHPNVREECPSPASTIIKGDFEDEYLKSTETVISKGLEDECMSSNTIIKSQSENERPSHVIKESEPVYECPSPTRTIIKSDLEAECLSQDIIIITSDSDDECTSPAVRIIKNESEDECSRPTNPIKTETLDECLSLTKTIIKTDCPSPAATIIKSESEDECSRLTSPVNAENGATDLGLKRQSFDECPSPAKTIIKSESEDECPSPAATIIKSESEDECSQRIKAENVSSRNVPATEVVHNDSQDFFVDSELETDQSISRSSSDNSLDRRESSSSQQQRCGINWRQKSFTKRQKTCNERYGATKIPASSSKALHHPPSFSDGRRSASTSERKRVYESDSGSEWDGKSDSESDCERVSLQRPKFERYLSKRPSSNANKRMEYRWSDIRFSVTPEKIVMEIDTTDDSEPEYGWEDPRPPKRTCVESKSTREVDPNLQEKMQIFIGKLSNEFDLDVIEESRKKLLEAIDESIAVQSTKKLSELDLKIQKKKDDYVLNLFGTDEFESWDNDPALSNVEATKKFRPLKLPDAANASLLDKMTRKHWENGT